MSAPATHGQGRSFARQQRNVETPRRGIATATYSHHIPLSLTVRPVDGQTGAKRTRGGVSARKRVRSPYSEPGRIECGKWNETHTERGRSTRAATGRQCPPLTRARGQNADNITTPPRTKRNMGRAGQGTNLSPRAPHDHALDTLNIAH